MAIPRRDFLVLSSIAAGLSAVDFPAFSQTDLQAPGNSQLYWPPNKALPAFPEAYHLDAADLTALSRS